MTKEILVCLEGSPSSEAALERAIETAREIGASLVGLAIVDEPDIRAGAATSIGGASFKHERDDALVADARVKADAWLQGFVTKCEGAQIAARPLEIIGRPATSILSELEARVLTVMGRDANFLFETDETDSATRHVVLHRAKRPVMIVPAEPSPDSRIVMIAYDGSSAANRAVRAFADSGLATGRAVHVASVDDNGAAAWETAERAIQMLRTAGIAAKSHNLVSPLDIPDALLELRAKLGAGLVVMGAYARTRVAELIWGSVTDDIIQKSPVPLFLHH